MRYQHTETHSNTLQHMYAIDIYGELPPHTYLYPTPCSFSSLTHMHRAICTILRNTAKNSTKKVCRWHIWRTTRQSTFLHYIISQTHEWHLSRTHAWQNMCADDIYDELSPYLPFPTICSLSVAFPCALRCQLKKTRHVWSQHIIWITNYMSRTQKWHAYMSRPPKIQVRHTNIQLTTINTHTLPKISGLFCKRAPQKHASFSKTRVSTM